MATQYVEIYKFESIIVPNQLQLLGLHYRITGHTQVGLVIVES
jgi:hypothetical protein